MTLLSHHDDHPALVDAATGATWSYAELTELIRDPPLGEGSRRELVLLELENCVDSVLAYLRLIEAGHVVMVTDSKGDHTDLAQRYEPALVRGRGDDPVRLGSTPPERLHPDLVLLLATSGSTGNPRFVRLSRNAVEHNAGAIGQSLGIDREARAVTALPLSYSYGLSVLHSHLAAGATVVVTGESVMERSFWGTCSRFGVTAFAGVPYTYQMLHRLRFDFGTVPTINAATQAGGRLRDDLVQHFHKQLLDLDGRFFVMYGQTEAGPRMTCLPAESLPEKLGSVGVPLPGGRLEILDEEVVYHGPNVMMGYADSAGDLALGDELAGVLHTGDLGRLDSDGFLYLTGRRKRIAKLFGIRVSLADVERLFEPWTSVAIAAGDDTIEVHYAMTASGDMEEARRAVARKLGVPARSIRLHPRPDGLPVTDRGKIDYAQL